MNRDTLLSLYDRLAGLVDKLPAQIKKPILSELTPIRETFLDQRPARLMLVGGVGRSVPAFLHSFSGVTVETGASEQGWRSYTMAGASGRGDVLILDARQDTPDDVVAMALAGASPDVVIFIREGIENSEVLEIAAHRVELGGEHTPLIGAVYGGESAEARLSALFSADRRFSLRRNEVSPATAELGETICAVLPKATALEFARLAGAKKAQAEIAGKLLKSFATVCGAIGLQPIPLADLPVLTALQSLMVGLIIYVSGKPVSPRLITEFFGAMGLNIGAGILFRESARAIIKFIPVWGNAVSGVVAGAGTYAVGRAAIAYFIEESPITEAKKLFQKLLPSWDAFKRRRLPGLKNKEDQ